MDELLEDYKSYYKARMDRYENDPFYPHSYQSEKALYESMNSCNELIEFKEKLGDLNIKNAIALVKDQETARLNHYTEQQEDVRSLGPKWILEKIDQATDANEVVTISMEMDQKASLAITIDGFVDAVWQDMIPQLENLEVMKNAIMPTKYEASRQADIQETEAKIQTDLKDLQNQARDWDANWTLNLDLVWEHRHRKKIPLRDETLEQRINELKKYT